MSRRSLHVVLLTAVTAVIASLAPTAEAHAVHTQAVGTTLGAGAGDTVALVDGEEQPTNIDIAVTIAQETFERSDTVLITRDDRFADALASGLLQDDAPLLMVPTDGPVPTAVGAEIASLGATRAVILGGTAAVSAAVETDLRDSGLQVERREGGSRFETAIDVAATDGAEATTVMLARAFPSPGGPESQGFADTLAAGGVSAREGYPILLTETERLTGPTAAYLAGSAVDTVLVMGGTAAISAEVTDELTGIGMAVERIAGDSRDETAIEIAKIAGDDRAADASRVIITQGEGENAWASGFALASHAAAFDAPIVLAQDGRIPAPTREFLDGGVGGDPSAQPVLTCAVTASLCEETRLSAGLPPADTEPFEDIGPRAISLSGDDVDRLTFEALPGERIGLGYRGLIPDDPNDVVCLSMTLTNPEDDQLATFDNGFTNCSDQQAAASSNQSILLSRGGTYTLQTVFRDGVAGSVEIFATATTEVDIEPGGPPPSIAFDRPGQIHRASFEGQQGDQVSLGYTNFMPGVVGRGVCTSIQLRSPLNSSLVGALDNGFRHCTERGPSQGLRDALVLPEDGSYAVETVIAFGREGSLDLHLTAVENVDLTVGTPIDVTLDQPGAIHRGNFAGTEGQTVTISYADLTSTDAQGEVCIDLQLLSPTGASVGRLNNGFSDCTGQTTTNTSDPLTLPISGNFVLEAVMADGRTGTVSVRVQ